MHVLTILQHCLGPLLTGLLHARRLATLLEAVAATVSGPRLTLTDIGRRFGGEASLRNKIKRSDRLLGNRHLQGQARTIYAALARKLLSAVLEPLIIIDWSDLKADQSLHRLRASLPVGGRSLTFYEEVTRKGSSPIGRCSIGSYSRWHSCCRPRLSRSSSLILASRCRSSARSNGWGGVWSGGYAGTIARSSREPLGQLSNDLSPCHPHSDGAGAG
jgi:hypothetical protein